MGDLSYDDWTEKLASFFFDEAHAGDEIVFAVDETSLAEISGLSETEAPASLAAAVGSVISDRWFVRFIVRRTREWRSSGAASAHPALPFLALTVLAASRMGEHDHVASHNYYVPLRTLIDPTDPETGAPGSFKDHIEWLWHDLAEWTHEDLKGRRGRLVVRPLGQRFVGLAIQHALVRSSDLRHLDAFFRRIGLEPGEQVPAAELRRSLGVWATSRDTPWARRLARISSDPDLKDYCEAILDRAARRWDGRPRDPRTGHPIGRLRLGVRSLRRPSLDLYAQWDERLPDAIHLYLGRESLSLTRWHGWFEPRPLPEIDMDQTLAHGLEVGGDIVRFSFPSDDAYALAYDDAPEMTRGTERLLPPGWTMIAKVRIDARPRHSPPACLASLIPVGGGPRLRLLGGLPVSSERGVYLRGGEPAVALSTLVESDEVTICKLSTGQVQRLRSESHENREIPLWVLELDPDQYEIAHGKSLVRLRIIDGIVESAGPGAGSVRQPGRDSSIVVGTSSDFPSHIRRPTTIRAPHADRSAYVIGRNPEEVASIDLPTWISSHVGFDPSWVHIDAWPSFDPVWELTPVGNDRYEASLLSEGVQPTTSSDDVHGSHWAELIAGSQLAADQDIVTVNLWRTYQAHSGAEPNDG